jgi:KH domain
MLLHITTVTLESLLESSSNTALRFVEVHACNTLNSSSFLSPLCHTIISSLQMHSTLIYAYIQVPNDRVGLIIGKGGATIKDLQNRSGARIQIPPQPDANSNPPVRTVSITGVGDAPQRAKYEIEQMVQSFETHGYMGGGGGGGGGGGYQQQQPQQPSAYGPPGGHYGAPQHAPVPYGAAPYGQPGAYGAPQPYGMPQQGYGMPQQPYDARYQQPGLSDPYAQQYGAPQQPYGMPQQPHYGQPQQQQPQQQQPVTAAAAANSGGAGAAAGGTAAGAAAAPAAAGNVDLTQYHSVSYLHLTFCFRLTSYHCIALTRFDCCLVNLLELSSY